MIKFDKVYQAGYATIIEGNGGEEQLTVLASYGQNGRCALTVVATQVDYGMDVLFQGSEKSELVTDTLEPIIRRWLAGEHDDEGRFLPSEFENEIAQFNKVFLAEFAER